MLTDTNSIDSSLKDEIFTKYGEKDSNKISIKNLKLAFRALGFEPKSSEITKITKTHATKGFISKELFASIFERKMTCMNKEDEIFKAFQLFDKDKNGKLSVLDLKRVSQELNEDIDEIYLKEMIEEADDDNDGLVSLEEFVKIMKKTGLY